MTDNQKISQKMQVQQETFIKASREKVWDVMTSVEGMSKWLGPRIYQPEQGAPIEFFVNLGDHQERMFGEIVTFDAPNEMSFTWTQHTIGGETWPAPTLVTITLTAETEGTRVKLVHGGFDQLPAEIGEREYPGYVAGWKQRPVLDGLKALVEA